MQFAILNGERTKPLKGLRAACPCCGELVIAKCGDFKVHHWAHLSRKMCDPWWETETDWHREWKEKFPESFREIVLFDEKTSEKHIADIKSHGNNIIEFQHSPISEEERISRETFYLQFGKNMTWVLDCSDRSFKFIFFQGFISDGKFEMEANKEIHWFGRSKLFHKWAGSKAFVLLDFGDEILWWLRSFDPINKKIVVNPRYKSTFINRHLMS